MSIELVRNDADTHDVGNTAWAVLLNMAQAYGWQPIGSRMEAGSSEWDGCYDASAGQTVIASDAAALAFALHVALRDTGRARRAASICAAVSAAVAAASGVEYRVDPPSGPELDLMLTQLADFCARGAFEIR